MSSQMELSRVLESRDGNAQGAGSEEELEAGAGHSGALEGSFISESHSSLLPLTWSKK